MEKTHTHNEIESLKNQLSVLKQCFPIWLSSYCFLKSWTPAQTYFQSRWDLCHIFLEQTKHMINERLRYRRVLCSNQSKYFMGCTYMGDTVRRKKMESRTLVMLDIYPFATRHFRRIVMLLVIVKEAKMKYGSIFQLFVVEQKRIIFQNAVLFLRSHVIEPSWWNQSKCRSLRSNDQQKEMYRSAFNRNKWRMYILR